jgi:hypothetical protein
MTTTIPRNSVGFSELLDHAQQESHRWHDWFNQHSQALDVSKECTEISVTLGVVIVSVSIEDLDTTTYNIDKWDEHGLTASYGGDESSRCQRHVLTIDFDSGAVSVSDIPTRKAGCEAFTETDSYKLVRGNYYVDTTPGNDLDKKKP